MTTRRYHPDGTIPENGEIFVFGSNLAGIHGAGAALAAKEKFGAKLGVGTGLVRESYAIPTKDSFIDTMILDIIKSYIYEFVYLTQSEEHADTRWFVTRIGCGLAGYGDEQIAPLFKDAANCSFAEQWRPYLEDSTHH
jgi:hypothetical protein